MLASLSTIWNRRQAIIALLLPVAGLLGFSGYIVAEKLELLRASHELRQAAAFTRSLTGLVHELQRERGQAALVLSSKDPAGEQFLAVLMRQFDATDRERENFERNAAIVEEEVPSGFSHRLEEARSSAASLIARRQALIERSIGVQQMLESYSGTIGVILEVGANLPQASASQRMLAAWSYLAQAKEEMGQERAIGSAMLAAKQLDLGLLAQLHHIQAAQAASIQIFLRYSGEEARHQFSEAMNLPEIKEAENLRQQLMQAAAAGHVADIAASRWYDVMTARIDTMRMVEMALAVIADRMVQENARRAGNAVAWTTLVVALLLTLSWTTLRRSEKRAERAGERLANAIENIPEGFALWGGDGTLVLSNSRYDDLQRKGGLRPASESGQSEQRLDDGRWMFARTTSLPNGERVEIYSDITEAKQRGLAVEASEERLRRLLENIVEGIISIGQDGTIRSFNRAAEQIFGYAARDVMGRDVSTVTGKLFNVGAERPGGEDGAATSASWYEGRVTRADGRQLIVEAGITQLRLPDEVLSVGIFRDITERRRAEEQLRKLFRAVEQSPVSVIITDVEGRIEYANTAFRRTTGYAAEDVLGLTVGTLKSGANAPAVYFDLWSTILSGQEWRGELCNRKKNGELLWEMVTISPVTGPDGTIENFIGLRENVTELKKVQHALDVEHDNMLRILSSMKDGICLLDEDCRIHYVNAAMEADFGTPDGRSCHEYLDMPCPRCADQPADEEVRAQFEWHGGRSGKTYEVVETPVESADGTAMKLCVFHDITIRKEAEEAMAKARLSAESANRAKTEFLAAMSHELRTPLNAIIGFSEIIADQVLGPTEARYLGYARDIRSSGQHLLALINDILDVAAIEIGRIVLHESPVNVAAAVDAAVNMLRERAERNAISMTVRPSPDLPLLLADERRIKQIFLNLMSNAVKFTLPGGRIEVAIGRADDGDLLVTVSDTGIGIAPADIPKALAAFSQVDSSLARRYEGTGLGLPLTKGLVELHGGSLDLSSELGVGTVVTVRFPRRRVMAREEAST